MSCLFGISNRDSCLCSVGFWILLKEKKIRESPNLLSHAAWAGSLGSLRSFSPRQDLRLTACIWTANKSQFSKASMSLHFPTSPTLVATWAVLVPSLIHSLAPVPTNITEHFLVKTNLKQEFVRGIGTNFLGESLSRKAVKFQRTAEKESWCYT